MKRATHIDKDGWYINGANVAAVFHSGTGEIRMRGKDVDRLAAYEDTGLEPREIEQLKGEAFGLKVDKQELEQYRALGPIDRLRELKQADDEGRCVVLPCKIFDKVWDVIAHYQFEVTEIDLLPYGKIVFRCGNKGTDDYAAFYGEDLGETFVLKEPKEKNSCTESEATLRREQDG